MGNRIDEKQRAQEPAALRIEDDAEYDDQEEWEYEYSTTETETYYLTLELSYPEYKDQQTKTIHHSRGGYYKNWLDQHSVGWRHADDRDDIEDDENDNDNDNDDNENNDEPLPEAEPDDDAPDARPDSRDKAKDKESGQNANPNAEETASSDKIQAKEDIQILELHSKHPVISYKGRLFEGSWAEIIGTEAIFTNHDPNNPLPALRHLNGNVDLLGASASRILTTEKVLQPQEPKEDHLEPIRDEWNIYIPVGKDRSGEKKQQARFLENLIALKKKKGETDNVTVYARDGKGKDFLDNRDPEYKPRRRKRMLDENGNEVIPKRLRPRGGRRPIGRPRLNRPVAGRQSVREEQPRRPGEQLSTPTPATWSDVIEVRDDDDEEDERGGESEGEDDGEDDGEEEASAGEEV